jgi:hypothetical protein
MERVGVVGVRIGLESEDISLFYLRVGPDSVVI